MDRQPLLGREEIRPRMVCVLFHCHGDSCCYGDVCDLVIGQCNGDSTMGTVLL